MALTRSELKLLIKDILVEILSEGLGNVQAAASRPLPPGRAPIQGSMREGRQNGNGRRKPDFDARLDTPLSGGRKPTEMLREQIKANSGGNPIMAAILADTAVTTLPKLVGDRKLGASSLEESGGSGSSRPLPQVEQINGTPEEVFGEETASRWADLAFAAPKKLA
jgi:hypothetical protein